MKTITISLYEFSELSSTAKERALQQHRDINADNGFWYDFTYEYFCRLCTLLGIEVSAKNIHFRGFGSQGDGSAFEGKINIPALLKAVDSGAWKEEYPCSQLHLATCDVDKRVIALLEKGLIDYTVEIRQSSHRYYTVSVDSEFSYRHGRCAAYPNIDRQLLVMEKWLEKTADKLNAHLYKSIEQDYDLLITDGAVQETLETNQYHFTIHGELAEDLAALAVH